MFFLFTLFLIDTGFLIFIYIYRYTFNLFSLKHFIYNAYTLILHFRGLHVAVQRLCILLCILSWQQQDCASSGVGNLAKFLLIGAKWLMNGWLKVRNKLIDAKSIANK